MSEVGTESAATKAAANAGRALLGKVIDDKYELIELLGYGGMGAVFRARHKMMNKEVVVKLLHRHLSLHDTNNEFFERFKREAQLASQIEHPNAISIHDFGKHKKQPYLVMQYNRGQSLKALLQKEGSLSAERAASIIAQVCDALSAAHAVGIVHRDLKPDNIMVTTEDDSSEFVQVLDFGLAKVVGGIGAEDNALTQTGVVMGTPRYMAPEQAIAAKLDERSDIYSIGVLLYEMLTGEPPFTADTAMKLMMKHIREKPLHPSERKPGYAIPQELDDAVLKAMKKEPKNRQQTAAELRDQVLAAVHQPDPGLSRSATRTPVKKVSKVANDDEAEPRGIRVGSLLAVVLVVCCMGFAANPLMTYFSPEEMAKRAAELELQQKIGKHITLAEDFEDKDDFDAAIYELNRALEIAPEEAKLYYLLGKMYSKEARVDQAVVVLENAIDIRPDYEEAHFALGAIHLQRGRLREAAISFKKTLDANPDNAAAKKNLKKILKQLKRKRTA